MRIVARFKVQVAVLLVAALTGCGGVASTVGSNSTALPALLDRPAGTRASTTPTLEPYLLSRLVPLRTPAAQRLTPSSSLRASNLAYVGPQGGSNNAPLYVAAYPAANRKNLPAVCKIPGNIEIQAISVDQSNNIYVSQAWFHRTQVFAPRCGRAIATYRDTFGKFPQNAAIDGNTIYIGDFYAAQVLVFAKGAENPQRTLGDASINNVFATAVDSHHNLYVSYLNVYGVGSVIEFPQGHLPGVPLPVQTPGYPGSIEFDRSDNLLLIDQQDQALVVYAPPYTGSPISTIALRGKSVQCTLDQPEKHLYCADYSNSAIDVYTYPAGSFFYDFTNFGQNFIPVSIALAPTPTN